MKFSKSSLIILILGVVVVGAIMAGMAAVQQARQKKELEQTLLASQKKLALVTLDALNKQQEQLITEKENYTAQIIEAKYRLTAPVDNIAGTEMLINLAHQFGVDIVSINSPGKADVVYTDNKFTALSYGIQVEGNTRDIEDFISNINILFPTSVVERYQVQIDLPSPTVPAPIPVTSDSDNTAASINVIIYDYKGDANVE